MEHSTNRLFAHILIFRSGIMTDQEMTATQRELYEQVQNASGTLSIQRQQIGQAEALAIARALEVNQRLTKLSLRWNEIDETGANAIAEALRENATLTQLDLHNNQIGASGARAIAEALRVNKTLTQLDLHNNQIGAAGASAIAEALTVNGTLTQLGLSSNGIGVGGANAIAVALRENATLTQLDLHNNRIGDDGAEALAEVLKVNATLIQLHLRTTWMSNSGAQAIAKALIVNSRLSELDLYDNHIGDDAKQAIAKALLFNSTMKGLDLDIDRQTKPSADLFLQLTKLREAINESSGTKDLDLSGLQVAPYLQTILQGVQTTRIVKLWLNKCQLGDAECQVIATELRLNTSLTSLELTDNQIGDAGALSISEALRENKTLQSLNLTNNQIGYVEETVLRHRVNQQFQLRIDDQRRSGSVRCQEVRVVVLGDPSVGKTSLVRGIADGYVRQAFSNVFNLAKSTDGIDISTVVLREKGESPMILIIWDFAGQEVYLVSHQFFLRERTVYLVLFDAREELSLNSRLAFWLRSLHACVPNADIILVGTHIDDPSYTSERQQEQHHNLANLLNTLQESSVSFNVRSTFYINARNSTGAPSMPELKTALFQAGQKMPFYNQPVDGRYLQFRDSLRKQADQLAAEKKPPLCRWHEIVKLGQSQNLSGQAIDEFMQLMRFQGWLVFHRLANSATPGTSNVPALQPATLLASLDDIVILNPQWFTKTVLTGVITQKPQDRWVKDGIVTRENLLRNAWKGIDSTICDQFVLLLQRYELLYKMSDADHPGADSASSAGTRYVIPSYLPAYKSDPSRWSLKPAAGEPHEVAIVMETKFLLEGFFARLVVRFHERQFSLTAWKDAVLVNYGGPRALLRVHRNDSNVRLEFTARGQHPEKLLPTLIEILDKLSSDWYPGISWETYLRCPMQVPHDKPCRWLLRPQVRDAVIDKMKNLSCSHTHITFPKEEWLPVLHSLLQRRLNAVSQPTPEDVEALRQLKQQPAPASEIQTAATQVASLVAAQLIASGTQTLQEVGAATIHSVREVKKQLTSSGVQQLQNIAAQSAQDLQRFNRALDGIIESISTAVKSDPVACDRLILSTVLRRIDELAKALDSRFDAAESLQQEQKDEIARFFTSQVQMQLDLLDKPCPLLFVVVPPPKKWHSKLTDLYKSSHTAHLLCAHMGTNSQPEWHRIDHHPGYAIEDLPRWLRDYGSRVRSLLRLVRPFLKLASLAGAPNVTGAVDSAINALQDPLKALPYLQRLLDHADQKNGSSAKGEQPAHASAVSSETDEYKSFAGLERAVVLSTGEVRWVCPKHAQDPIYCTSSFSSSSFAGNAPSSSSSINVASSSSAAFSISSNSNSNAPSSSSAGTSSNTPSIAAPGNGTGNSSVGNAASSSSNVNVASSSSAPSASTP
ncbi:hypothetical protein CAOG_002071 [Capsaspora owczarzaki ATCC 30864]|uniref:non-specific serine/threonine protein kinase n=1 Tax=Capsaspora owczarzaki (strain ATCC 30864) TaxID=595528 RepID=A0A0D2X1H7_CAPO3|nr:hypothetical protein CAOG_002071 [Capsaspora owczarzaki ATCC 30864]